MRRLFGVVPAAGRSRRMGRPKLLLDLGGKTVIRRLIETLRRAGIDDVFILVSRDDIDLQAELGPLPVHRVVAEDDPPEMRDSVERLLDEIERTAAPAPHDGWLLIPADHPFVEIAVLERLLDARRAEPGKIVVPEHGQRRGHPTLFPWPVANEVRRIPRDQGLNQLLRCNPARVVEVTCAEPSVLFDLDTPDDYARALERIK